MFPSGCHGTRNSRFCFFSLLSLYSPLRCCCRIYFVNANEPHVLLYLLLLDNLKDRQFCGFGFSFAYGDGFQECVSKEVSRGFSGGVVLWLKKVVTISVCQRVCL